MTRYRHELPQLDGTLFLSDGGIETTLIYHDGLELPDFAAFDLLGTEHGEAALRRYFLTYAELARRFETGLVLETPTWRASPDWGTRLGYDAGRLTRANADAVTLVEEIRALHAFDRIPIVVSGCVGPRGDGYVAGECMTPAQAQAYHARQVETFAVSSADMVSAITMTYAEEAVGITRAAREAGMPVAISFTVETDGRLPTGQTLKAAIARVDTATDGYPAYYMINCAHPTHFEEVLRRDEPWVQRIRGLRANASCLSHAELNAATSLDIGNPDELGDQYASLRARLPWLTVLGGCCGTDHRHIEAIARACAGPALAGADTTYVRALGRRIRS